LVRGQWGEEVAERTTVRSLQAGAVLTGHDDQGTACGWAMSAAGLPFGAFVAWAHSHEVGHLHVCADLPGAEAVAWARRATAFNLPVTIWRVAGTGLTEVEPMAVEPFSALAGSAALARLAPGEAAFVPVIKQAGADPVVEDGVLRAEVLGLEVARVVSGPGGPALAVGVGRHDREARDELAGWPEGGDHGADLAGIVATVRGLRVAGAPVHPANQLAPERWLRSVVLAHPQLVGAESLEIAPAPVVRRDLRDRAPAPAVGTGASGEAVVVVCSVGVDPDLVPLAADARLGAVAAGSIGEADPGRVGLFLVVPQGDDYPLTRELAGLLRHPAEVVTVGPDWRRQ
jgi:hypothetical protein